MEFDSNVYNVALAALLTSIIVSVPIALAVALRLRSALPQYRPSKKLLRDTSVTLPNEVTSTSSSSSFSLSSDKKVIINTRGNTLNAIKENSFVAHTHRCTTTIFLGSGGHTAEMLQLISGLDISKYSPRHYVVGIDDHASVEKVHRFESSRHQRDVTTLFKSLTTAHQRQIAEDAGHLNGYTIHRIPRSRHVHQSLLTTPLTLVKSLIVAIPLIKHLTFLSIQKINHHCASVPSQPSEQTSLERSSLSSSSSPSQDLQCSGRRSILLMNGPGTCLALALAVIGARMIGISDELTPDLVFVESFARVQTLSLAGKLLYPLSDVFLVQWPKLKERYPRSHYIGTLV